MAEPSDLIANAGNVDNEATHSEEQAPSEKHDPAFLPVVGKYRLTQDDVKLYKEASINSTVVTSAGNGEILTVKGWLTVEGNGWLQILHPFSGKVFIPADTQMEKVVARFKIERVVFIIVTSLAVGPFAGMIDKSSGTNTLHVEGIIWVAMALTVLYVAGRVLFGLPILFETVRADVETPMFDWRRFVREPLKFVLVALAVVLIMAVIGGLRSCSGHL